MKRQELQKMKKLAGLLTEELDVSWNPFEHNYEYQSIQSSMIKTAKEYLKKAGLDPDQEYPPARLQQGEASQDDRWSRLNSAKQSTDWE